MSENTSVLITGANRGIGLALASYYISQGCEVVCTCRSEQVASLQEQISKLGGKPENIIPVTLGDSQQIEQLADLFPLQSLDILINNAALGDGAKEAKFKEMNPSEWSEAFRVNTIAPIYLTKKFLPFLENSPSPLVIMITSHLASISINDSPDSVLYGASKAALNSAVKRLTESSEIKSRNVIFGLVHPGSVQTRLSGFQGLSPEVSARNIAGVADKFRSGEYKSGSFVDSESLSILPW